MARAGKGEISPIDQQRIVLKHLEDKGQLTAAKAMKWKKRLAHDEKAGTYRITDLHRVRQDCRVMLQEAKQAQLERDNPEPNVTDRDAVEAARVLNVFPEAVDA